MINIDMSLLKCNHVGQYGPEFIFQSFNKQVWDSHSTRKPENDFLVRDEKVT